MKEKLLNILKSLSEIDWFIIHKLSNQGFKQLKFSFIDNKERLDYPFKKNLGYVSFLRQDDLSIFEELILELNDNDIALANLYILILRTSLTYNEHINLEKIFIETVGKEKSYNVFLLLAQSLNDNYYAHLPISRQNCNTLDDWLDLIHETQYLHDITDILNSVLFLVVQDISIIEYDIIKIFSPFIRARLISWFGINLKITKDKLLNVLKTNEYEAAFFGALLVENRVIPEWLDKKVLEILLVNYWDNVGKSLFRHLFGISYKTKHKDINKINSFVYLIFTDRLKKNDEFNQKWIDSFSFPEDFIAFFYWLHLNRIDLNSILEVNIWLIAETLINSLKKLANDFVKYLSDDKLNPLNTYNLYEKKYKISLSYSLLFLCSVTDKEFKRIKKEFKNLAYNIKPQFYGNYNSQHLAKEFTEILLLIVLSAIYITNVEKIEKRIKDLLDILINTVLIPYIHLTERNSEIWHNLTEEDKAYHNIGIYLINEYLKKIYKNVNNLRESFENLFMLFDQVKVTTWPFEKDI